MKKGSVLTVGVDLGGTKISAGLCREGEILKKVIFPTNASKGYEHVINLIADACRKVVEGHGESKIMGVGIGAAGQIEPGTGVVVYAPNLNWHNAALGSDLKKILGLPVRVTNDVRSATVAEWRYGAARGLDNFVNIFVGTGIGSGMVINGMLVEGVTNSAGEIGHICLDPTGPLCGCGKKGCFEAYASGRGLENHVKHLLEAGQHSLIRELVEGKIDMVTGPIIGEAARKGDKLALTALGRLGNCLGIVMANLHTLLNPDTLVLGGGMMALSEFFIKNLEESLRKHILPVALSGKELFRMAAMTNDAVLVGGAAIWL